MAGLTENKHDGNGRTIMDIAIKSLVSTEGNKMSKFILVYYGTDFGMDMLGEYATKQDAFNAMIREIERTYKPCVDMSKCRPDDNGCYEHREDCSTLYWGDDWADCYGLDAYYSDHYKIFEI